MADIEVSTVVDSRIGYKSGDLLVNEGGRLFGVPRRYLSAIRAHLLEGSVAARVTWSEHSRHAGNCHDYESQVCSEGPLPKGRVLVVPLEGESK